MQSGFANSVTNPYKAAFGNGRPDPLLADALTRVSPEAQKKTRAPCPCNARTVAAPIPLAPPVTTACFPRSPKSSCIS
jgi:hypothetical protein